MSDALNQFNEPEEQRVNPERNHFVVPVETMEMIIDFCRANGIRPVQLILVAAFNMLEVSKQQNIEKPEQAIELALVDIAQHVASGSLRIYTKEELN